MNVPDDVEANRSTRVVEAPSNNRQCNNRHIVASFLLFLLLSNIFSAVMCSLLFIGFICDDDCDGWFCIGERVLGLAGFCIAWIGVAGICQLNSGEIYVAGIWYTIVAILIMYFHILWDPYGPFLGWWVALEVCAVVFAILHFALLIAMREGIITRKDQWTSATCCCGVVECCNRPIRVYANDNRYLSSPNLCLPYSHRLVVASLFLSILATLLSPFVDYVFLLGNIVVAIPFQILWCMRCKRKTPLYSLVGVAILGSLASVGYGILIIYADSTCEYYINDFWEHFCWYGMGVGIVVFPFGCGILWAMVAVYMFVFVHSGHHEMWELTFRALSNRPEGEVASIATEVDPSVASLAEVVLVRALDITDDATVEANDNGPPSSGFDVATKKKTRSQNQANTMVEEGTLEIMANAAEVIEEESVSDKSDTVTKKKRKSKDRTNEIIEEATNEEEPLFGESDAATKKKKKRRSKNQANRTVEEGTNQEESV